MTPWKKILQCEEDFVWVQGADPRAPAVISPTLPPDTARALPLHVLLSQLDPTEWTVVEDPPAS